MKLLGRVVHAGGDGKERIPPVHAQVRGVVSRAFVPPCIQRTRRWTASLGPVACVLQTGTLDALLMKAQQLACRPVPQE